MTPAWLRLILIASAGALLTCCGGTATVERPIPETSPDTVLELSRIATPILIPIEDLQRLVDRRLSGELYSESRQITTGVTMDVTVNRRDSPIAMDMSGNTLSTVVPLNVNGSVTLGFGPFSLGRVEGFDADLDVRLSSSVKLNSDWSVASDSAVAIDVQRANITIPGIDLNATGIIEEILRRNSERIAAPLDNYLADIDLRAMLQPVWESFAEPIQLTEEPPVWLRVEPVAFNLAPAQASSENLRFDVGMEMYIDSVVGERPESLTLGPIPPLGEASEGTGTFKVAIPITLGLDAATEAISNQIVGREDTIGSRARVRWLGIELSGTGDRLQATVDFEANTGLPIVNELSGEMALEGRPSYDPDTQTLRVTDLDYELTSDSRLAGFADRLLHTRLRDRIQEEMVFPLGEMIEEIRERLGNELGSVSLANYGTIDAQIETLSPRSVRVSEPAVELLVKAEGVMSLDLTLPVN